MLCLVPEQMHRTQCSYAAAAYNHRQKHPFRYAPIIFSSLIFINAKEQKSNKVDKQKIAKKYLHTILNREALQEPYSRALPLSPSRPGLYRLSHTDAEYRVLSHGEALARM